jgi:hypothetical protein
MDPSNPIRWQSVGDNPMPGNPISATRLWLYNRRRLKFDIPKFNPGVFRSDPLTASDDAGIFFYLSLRSDGFSFFCDDKGRSINGGETWSLIFGKQGAIGGDKQWFTHVKRVTT